MARPVNKHSLADLTRVSQSSLSDRPNRTEVSGFGQPYHKSSVKGFLESLPKFLKANDFTDFVDLALEARANGKPFHWLLGAHTIKVGLSPIIIDLLKRKVVTGLSFNGAGIIHDLELAFLGGTSEDVQAGLNDGSFGMVRETATMFAEVCALAEENGLGLGQATGLFINRKKAEYRSLSVFAQAERLGIPVTVHVGIGTDIVAQHPEYDAAAAAVASHRDFRILASVCDGLDRGGVLANIGSAVMLPEVFLKALTVARNLKRTDSQLTTANFDMIMHYRPCENVVKRPTDQAGRGFSFVGHHEIMIPLLAWALTSKQR